MKSTQSIQVYRFDILAKKASRESRHGTHEVRAPRRRRKVKILAVKDLAAKFAGRRLDPVIVLRIPALGSVFINGHQSLKPSGTSERIHPQRHT